MNNADNRSGMEPSYSAYYMAMKMAEEFMCAKRYESKSPKAKPFVDEMEALFNDKGGCRIDRMALAIDRYKNGIGNALAEVYIRALRIMKCYLLMSQEDDEACAKNQYSGSNLIFTNGGGMICDEAAEEMAMFTLVYGLYESEYKTEQYKVWIDGIYDLWEISSFSILTKERALDYDVEIMSRELQEMYAAAVMQDIGRNDAIFKAAHYKNRIDLWWSRVQTRYNIHLLWLNRGSLLLLPMVLFMDKVGKISSVKLKYSPVYRKCASFTVTELAELIIFFWKTTGWADCEIDMEIIIKKYLSEKGT